MGERWIVDDEPSQRYPIYTRGNVGEVFPDPVAPLSATLAITPYAEPGWRDAYVRAGVFTADEFSADHNEITGIFGGYCYLNVSITRIMAVRIPGMTPELVDTALFGAQPGVPPYDPQPTDEDEERATAAFEWLIWIMTATDLPDLAEEEALTKRLRDERPVVASLSDAELVARMRSLYAEHFRRLFSQHIFVSNAVQIPLAIVTQTCEALGDPTLAMRLVAGLGDVESAAPSWAMWELGRRVARSEVLSSEFDAGVPGLLDRLEGGRGAGEVDTFLGELAAFLHDYGSRGPNEWDMRSPTWETRPELALAAIDRMRLMIDADAPQTRHDERVADREELAASVAAELADQPEVLEQFQQALAAASVFFPGRERSKTNAVRFIQEGRVLMHELGRRMVAAGHFTAVEDFGMLTEPELDAFLADPASLVGEIKERKARYDELAALTPPFLFAGEQPPVETWARRTDHTEAEAAAGEVLTGIPGCPGSATGRARVILDPSEPGALEPGDVLVAPITDPSWTPLFVPASAVVVDVGAQLSHAIIVSRELGIPCVVSVTGATQKIPDGARVTVDGTTGTVSVHEDVMTLEGIRVVELGVWVAGPSTGGLMAHWGADVIKVEAPAGDPMRRLFAVLAGHGQTESPPFDLDNRGKRSVVFDLTTAEGRDDALALVATADVFLTNLRPEAVDRLGLGAGALLAANPRLVYASVTGYGRDGPDAHRAGYDVGAFWARTGIARSIVPEDEAPVDLRAGMGDHVTGLTTLSGILAALFQRERTGTGQLVETSLLRTGIYCIGWDMGIRLRFGKLAPTRPRTEMMNPMVNCYRAADGAWFWLLGVEADRLWPKLVAAIDRPDLNEDERFATARGRRHHSAEVIAVLDEVFAQRDRDDWTARFDAHDVWWAPAHTLADVIADPQAEAAGVFVDVPGGASGPAHRAVATPVTFSTDDAARPLGPVPALGEHTEEIRRELGRT